MRSTRSLRLFAIATTFALGALAMVLNLARSDAAAGPYSVVVPLVAREVQPVATSTPTFPATATPTATPTLAPTQTATPTRTPTQAAPSPSPVSQGLSVRKTSSYTSSTGTLYVVGEVVNNLSQAAQYVEITANFYNAAGTLVATDFTFSDVNILAPGADSPFELLLFDPPEGIVRYTVSVTDYQSPPFSNRQPISGLVLSVTNTYTSSTGTLHVVGTVRNSSAKTYRFVEPITALYDAAGNVVQVDFTFTSPDTLAPGQSGTFDNLFFDPPAYQSMRHWVEALE